MVIRCPDHPEATQLSKRLPGSMTVQKLKGLLRRVHKVDSSRQRLSYLDSSVRREREREKERDVGDIVVLLITLLH